MLCKHLLHCISLLFIFYILALLFLLDFKNIFNQQLVRSEDAEPKIQKANCIRVCTHTHIYIFHTHIFIKIVASIY